MHLGLARAHVCMAPRRMILFFGLPWRKVRRNCAIFYPTLFGFCMEHTGKEKDQEPRRSLNWFASGEA
jgi:hypothetical protein